MRAVEVGPLLDVVDRAIAVRSGRVAGGGSDKPDQVSGVAMGDRAVLLGVSPRTLWRWCRSGWVPFWAADRAVCALGLHPLLVWPGWCDGDVWSDDELEVA